MGFSFYKSRRITNCQPILASPRKFFLKGIAPSFQGLWPALEEERRVWSARTCYRVPLGRRVIVINEAKMVCLRVCVGVPRNGEVKTHIYRLASSDIRSNGAVRSEYRVCGRNKPDRLHTSWKQTRGDFDRTRNRIFLVNYIYMWRKMRNSSSFAN